ncbi:hypothetical protein F0562_033280 [Nyssa sinensis]|uniref:Uncharacterized protein n=1 Tax=Nyssa sinensis TaxID=561372 RepID=A0A5J5AUR7_9ASTE|nr:hypothetical protein F0562_033280 [Nyssa sinensis]
MGTHRVVSGFPQAVLATDRASEQLAGKFNLDGNTELQVDVSAPIQGSLSQIDIQVTNSSDTLILHWGGIRNTKEKWVLPSRRPDGTKVYKNKALRTPFLKSGSNSFLKIEIGDPAIQAIEFLIFDEAQNKWFKNNGENFHIKLPLKEKLNPNVSVPEDLVQIQAYTRWERMGKQMYTPEQEKEEYEAARVELLEEIARGCSIQDLRARLTSKNDKRKPNYSPQQQLIEFEEARKELQVELSKGTSLDEIQKKITKGEIQTKVAKQLERKRYFTVERIQRKKRELKQLLNKYASRKYTGLADKELLVLVTKPAGKTKVHLATDLKEPVILHWALSKKPGEWLAPPPSVLPPASVSLDKASETPFASSFSDDPTYKVQSLEIEVEDDNFVGMPFVLLSGGNWIKNKGSDFYVGFSVESKHVQKRYGKGFVG